LIADVRDDGGTNTDSGASEKEYRIKHCDQRVFQSHRSDHNARDEHCQCQTLNSTAATGRGDPMPKQNVENEQRAVRKCENVTDRFATDSYAGQQKYPAARE
jgi:hypothetical protein